MYVKTIPAGKIVLEELDIKIAKKNKLYKYFFLIYEIEASIRAMSEKIPLEEANHDKEGAKITHKIKIII